MFVISMNTLCCLMMNKRNHRYVISKLWTAKMFDVILAIDPNEEIILYFQDANFDLYTLWNLGKSIKNIAMFNLHKDVNSTPDDFLLADQIFHLCNHLDADYAAWKALNVAESTAVFESYYFDHF